MVKKANGNGNPQAFEAGGPIAADGSIHIRYREARAASPITAGGEANGWLPARLVVNVGSRLARPPGKRTMVSLCPQDVKRLGLTAEKKKVLTGPIEIEGVPGMPMRIDAVILKDVLDDSGPTIIAIDVLLGRLVIDGPGGEWSWCVPLDKAT